MRLIAEPSVVATQTEPPPQTMLAGSPPTGIRSTIDLDVASIRETVCPLASATQIEPAPTATAAGGPARDRSGELPGLGAHCHEPARIIAWQCGLPRPSGTHDHGDGRDGDD